MFIYKKEEAANAATPKTITPNLPQLIQEAQQNKAEGLTVVVIEFKHLGRTVIKKICGKKAQFLILLNRANDKGLTNAEGAFSDYCLLNTAQYARGLREANVPIRSVMEVPRYSENNVKIARYFMSHSIKILYSSEG